MQRASGGPSATLVNVWAAFWVLRSVTVAVALAATNVPVIAVAEVCDVVAALLAVAVVQRITALQAAGANA